MLRMRFRRVRLRTTSRPDASGWLVLPGDMPLVRPASLRAVADALDQQPIAFAQYRGRHTRGGVEVEAEATGRVQGAGLSGRLPQRTPECPVDQEGKVIGHCHTQGEAIDLAIREAQHTHSRGDDVVVCVEQDDGHYALAWSSH